MTENNFDEQAQVTPEATPEDDIATGEIVEEPTPVTDSDRVAELETLLAERTADLQRLGAEYVNYKKRVDRDRLQSRQAGVESVVQDLLPVLDSIALARQHEDLGEGFRLVADELNRVAVKHGLVGFGEVGEAFDPNLHEALMQLPLPDGTEVDEPTVSQVMQPGYMLGDRVLRPARVGVANPA
ncbi:nucleotide exchange factor GrpE [Propionibacteriaceae bacterium G57]|uniref:nucleotide exchange factor GrpE n=1 Tax=Aestuariimicrobium sp. G57 TaxID=3418485 RepID=UPI003DA75169